MKIQEYYENIAKESELPSYEDMCREFDIDSIDEENHLAKKISERIVEVVEKYRKIVEEFINVDGSNIAVLMEIKEIDEDEKEKINEVYKGLIMIEREFLLSELTNSEEQFISFIRDNFVEWQTNKDKIKKIIKKARDSWTKDDKIKERLGYLG